MPYLYVENFESGLDTRKSAFTAPPGSLRILKNAHITRGKEIERRKGFADFASLPAGTHGLHSAKGQLYVFGSVTTPAGMPPTVKYQRLQSSTGGAMTRIWDVENFNGKAYVVAEYDSGAVHHFYDGAIVADWETLAQNIAEASTVAAALGQRAQENAAAQVEVIEDTLILTGDPGVAFTATASASGTGAVTVTELQAATAAQAEVPATASFDITGGSTGQNFNQVERVEVDGLDLLGDAVDFDTDNATTAQAVADRINAYTTDYSAAAAGATVTITAPNGLGASANGRVLSVDVTGNVTVGNLSNMAGGQDPVDAVAQITQVTVDTYAQGSTYTLTVDGTSYSVIAEYSAIPLTIRTVNEKIYAVTGSLLYFSGFSGDPSQADPTQWRNDGANEIGAGFINLSTQYSGSDNLVGIGVYQGKVAAFSQDAIQIWAVDPDPAQNIEYQVLLNIGANAPGSIVEYGDLDIFFLSDSGVRSLRARDSSNLASADDVGVAIDRELTDYMATLGAQQIRNAKAVVEPTESRYLLAVGARVYVFSNFPGSRVSAWSTYELGSLVDNWAVAGTKLYARVGDTVKLYGGATGNEYGNYPTVVQLPFLDSGNPAGVKQFEGVDLGAEGTWDIELATEPNNADEWTDVATIGGSSYGSHQRIPAEAESTHFSMRLTCDDNGPALLGNAVLHYRDVRAD